MKGIESCKNKLSFTDCLGLEFQNNLPTLEVMILKELSLDIRSTIIKYKGSILNASEIGENNYLIFISTMIIRVVDIDNKMVAVDISDTPSFIKGYLNNSNSQLDCLN